MLKYIDFVIWTEKALFVERIFPDSNFWEQNVPKAKEVFLRDILPEPERKVVFLDQCLQRRGQWAQKTLCHTRQEKEAAVIGHLYPSVIAEEESMGKWLAVIMTIASIGCFTWTVLN